MNQIWVWGGGHPSECSPIFQPTLANGEYYRKLQQKI